MSKYKLGDKVVLTVTGTAEMGYFPRYVLNDNFNLWKQSIDELVEPLSTYTEPLEAKISRQAAEITRLLAENKRLKAENGNSLWNIEQARAEGAEAAWELARKINDMDIYDTEEIFIEAGAFHLGNVLENYTYPEAAAKVAEWEKAKEIKAGDIVESNNGNGERIAVIDVWPSFDGLHFEGISSNGTLTIDASAKYYTKTGRHIDIGSFLKQIGEE